MVRVLTFAIRFSVLLVITAYLEGNRGIRGRS
jgi:hypothetical protein